MFRFTHFGGFCEIIEGFFSFWIFLFVGFYFGEDEFTVWRGEPETGKVFWGGRDAGFVTCAGKAGRGI
jgi:hypothetical protein